MQALARDLPGLTQAGQKSADRAAIGVPAGRRSPAQLVYEVFQSPLRLGQIDLMLCCWEAICPQRGEHGLGIRSVKSLSQIRVIEITVCSPQHCQEVSCNQAGRGECLQVTAQNTQFGTESRCCPASRVVDQPTEEPDTVVVLISPQCTTEP